MFPIVADERAKPYGWRWSDDASSILPVLPRAHDGVRVDVSLRLSRRFLPDVLATLGSSDYKLVVEADPLMTVTLKVDDSPTTRRAIFALCDEVEVLTPREWRHDAAERARRALAKHGP